MREPLRTTLTLRADSVTGAYLAVGLAAALVYANSLWNGFAYDDNPIILNNSRVHQLADQTLIWLRPYWPASGEEYGLYRPLTIFGFALQWALGRGAPWVFHLGSVLLHVAVTLLVLRLLRFFLPLTAAFAGALVFAVHPVHTEAVANVVGQSELLAALATLAACVLHASRPPGPHVGWWRRGAYVILYLVALLSKESAVLLPALLVVIDIAQRRVRFERRSLDAYARASFMPFFLFAASLVAYLALRVSVLGSIRGVDAGPSLPYLREEFRLLSAFRAWPEFARLLFVPLDLSADYGPAVILPTTSVTPMAALGLVLLLATIGTALLVARAPRAGLPAAWFLITILTVSNLFFPIGVLVAERTLYTPSVALSFVVGAVVAAAAALPASRRRALVAAFAVVIVLLGVRTWIRNPDWESTAAFGQALLRDRPESYRAQWMHASLLHRAGALRDAHHAWQLAYAIWPRDPGMLTDMGIFYYQYGDYDRAARYLEEAAGIMPWHIVVQMNLALAYLGGGRFGEALDRITAADRIGGVSSNVILAAYARAYEGLGLRDQALGAWLAASRTAAGAGNPFVQARIARAASAAGHDARARTALDSLRALVAQVEASPLANEPDRLARAIGAGCFRAPNAALEGCADPLPFALPGEPGAPHPASQLQYATPGALPVGVARPDPPH